MTQKILFVCRHNTIRSVMAAALMAKIKPDRHVESAGIDPRERADDYTEIVLREAGMEVIKHCPRSINDININDFDRLVTFGAAVSDQLSNQYTQGEVEVWPIDSPVFGSFDIRAVLENYRMTRDDIMQRITASFGK